MNENYMRFKKTNFVLPAEIFIVFIQILILLTVFYCRLDFSKFYIKNPVWIEPQTLSPFTPDEVNYLSGKLVREMNIFEILENFLSSPRSTNFWGNFVYNIFVKNGFGWKEIALFNMGGYFLFSIIIFFILKKFFPGSHFRMLVYSFIVLNPALIQVTVSSLRDIWIYLLYALFLLNFLKRNFGGMILSLLLFIFLRLYMIPVALFFFLVGYPKKKLYGLILYLIIISIFVATLLNLYPIVIENLKTEFPKRFVYAFTGINIYLFTGKLNFFIISSPFLKLEYIAHYFFFLSYLFLWFLVFKKRLFKILFFDNLILASLASGLFLVILHSAMIGFLVARIQYLVWFPLFIAIMREVYK